MRRPEVPRHSITTTSLRLTFTKQQHLFFCPMNTAYSFAFEEDERLRASLWQTEHEFPGWISRHICHPGKAQPLDVGGLRLY